VTAPIRTVGAFVLLCDPPSRPWPDPLSRPLTKNAERVDREGLSLLLSSQARADARQVSIQTLLALAAQLVCHAGPILSTSIEIVNTTQGFVEDKVRNKRQMTTQGHWLSRAAILDFPQ
jgi:hypothetical protein